MRRYNQGWRAESERHSLAARKVKTGSLHSFGLRKISVTKGTSPQEIEKFESAKAAIHNSIVKDKNYGRLSARQKLEVDKALMELRTLNTKEKLKFWVMKHRYTFSKTGLATFFVMIASIPFFGQIIPEWTAMVELGFAGAAGVQAALSQSEFKSKKAESLFDNRVSEVNKLVKRGYSVDEAKEILKSKIMEFERKAR